MSDTAKHAIVDDLWTDEKLSDEALDRAAGAKMSGPGSKCAYCSAQTAPERERP